MKLSMNQVSKVEESKNKPGKFKLKYKKEGRKRNYL
jgi:hypothetical protein